MVLLTDELVALLDQEAVRRGKSRSAVIREVLEGHFAQAREAEIGRQIADGYRRVPPGTPDEWGDLESLGDRANRDLLRRLEAEERRAGVGPWKQRPGDERGRSR